MKIYVDGSTTRVCYIIDDEPPVVIPLRNKVTVNMGEYLAVLYALKALPRETEGQIEILSDSQLIVNQLNKKWAINKRYLYMLAVAVWRYWGWRQIKYTWIPREENPAGKVLG